MSSLVSAAPPPVPVGAARGLVDDLADAAGAPVSVVACDGRPIAASAGASEASEVAVEAAVTLGGRSAGLVRVHVGHGEADARAVAVARLGARLVAERAGQEAELDAMAEELLSRYEEITMLFELGEALGAVFEVEQTARIALERALLATRAGHGFVSVAGGPTVTVAASGAVEPDPVAELVARRVGADGRPVLLHEGQSAADDGPAPSAPGPLLVVPLLPMAPADGDTAALGALALSRPSGAARFTAGDAKLANSVAMQLAGAMRATAAVASLRQAERVRRELEIAATVQRALLPGAPPPVPGVELAGRCVPAANIGGDLYDHLVDARGRLWLVIADVAGHSVGSALLMAMARTVLRREIADGNSPAEVVAATSATLYGDLEAANLFITVFCARLDAAAGELVFASGGHNPPLLRHADGRVAELDAEGMPAGFVPDCRYEERRVPMRRGDMLVLYTDGVVEAHGAEGAMLGEDRLRDLVRDAGDAPPQGLVDAIFDSIRAHGAGIEPADDITVLVARMVGEG